MERYSGLFVMLLFMAVSMDAQKPSDFRADAERGEREAQFNLGLCYYYGDGTSVDYHEAFNWFLKSAQQGYDKAQCNVGRMYHSGLGIKKDCEQSVFWLRKSANQGYAMALFFLGVCYNSGEGVKLDKDNALYLFIKSSAKFHAMKEINDKDSNVVKKCDAFIKELTEEGYFASKATLAK